MTTNEDYLRNLLDSQELNENQLNHLSNLRKSIKKIIKTELSGNSRVLYGGSFGKNTMIKASYDLDVVFIGPNPILIR